MDTYRSEEEQVEALKNWWRENGTSTLASVALAIGLIVGYRFWQDSQQAALDASAFAYQQFSQAVMVAESSPDDIKIATAGHLADGIKEQYEGSTYSQFAALYKARQAVADGALDAAIEELLWVLEQQPSADLRSLTELRLARVYIAQQKFDDAKALIDAVDTSSSFASAFAEVRGDMLLASQDYSAAVDAYQSAQTIADAQQMQASPTLSTKLAYAKGFF